MTRIAIPAALLMMMFCVPTEAQVVPCESTGGYRECRVGTGGTVRLLRETSMRRCTEGLTWGMRSHGVVWVDAGCSGMFTLVTDHREKGIVCESRDGRLNVCSAEAKRDMTLAQQLSKTPCVKGESWDYDPDRREVWVDRGCRGEFVTVGGTPAKPAPALYGVVNCASENGRRTECRADTSAGVQIMREVGESPCRFGREWGYDAKGIWVDKSCRAEFAVKGKSKPMALSLTCESADGERKHCDGETTFGVALVRQLSESACVLGRSWGFDATGVWVSAGCRGQFALGGFRLPADAVPATAARVPCESLDGQRTLCATDASRGVGLIRQLTDDSVCILNRTWGYDGAGIWVSGGCRAEFAVAR